MKVGILTFFNVLNYGAVLQAYALQKVLSDMGHEVFLVNFQPKTLVQPYYRVRVRSLWRASYRARVMRRLRLFPSFREFDRKFLHVGTKYATLKSLYENPPKADAYIVGSDQVWNFEFTESDKQFYFIPFLSGSAKKIAYAASCGGNYSFLKDNSTKALLQKFDNIAVREKSLGLELEKHGFNSEVVVDPTLLLNDYSDFITENTKGDYILVYNVSDNQRFRDQLSYLKKITDLPVINIGANNFSMADQNLRGTSPQEWVNLFYNARYVYTNSFHGVAFSVQFRKNFLYIPNRQPSDSRILDFLSKIGLSTAVINDYENIDNIAKSDRPLAPNEHFELMRQSSLKFLTDSLR